MILRWTVGLGAGRRSCHSLFTANVLSAVSILLMAVVLATWLLLFQDPIVPITISEPVSVTASPTSSPELLPKDLLYF